MLHFILRSIKFTHNIIMLTMVWVTMYSPMGPVGRAYGVIIIIIIIIIIHVLYRRGRKVNVSVFTALLFKSFQDSRRHTHTALGDENSKV